MSHRARSAEDKALHRLLENAAALQRSAHVTTREVKYLREAFNATVPANERSVNQLAIQCDNLLHLLEKRCGGDSTAHSGGDAAAADGGDGSRPGVAQWKFTDIPARRRLQTLVVTMACFFTGMPFCLALTGLLLWWEWTRWPMLAYIAVIVLFPPRHPLPVWRWFADCVFFQLYRDYFPVRLVIDKAVRRLFNQRRNYIFCYHPHGVHSFGALLGLGSNCNGIYDMLPGLSIHIQTLGINFFVPFWREMVRWAGMGDASAKTIESTLASGPGKCVALVVGGAEESLLAAPNTNDLLLSKRKGFVKIALRTGCPLVPVFGFGETNVYGNHAAGRPWLQKLLLKTQKVLGFALPLIKGRGWFNYNFGPLPHRKLIIVVVGAPVELPHLPNPTQADIDHWHTVYVESLMKLYREHKSIYDAAGATRS
jgi:2-acylglycerol O-acyltransferase 2